MVLHTSERELFICGPGPAFISLKALISNPSMKDFLLEIAKNVLDLVSIIFLPFNLFFNTIFTRVQDLHLTAVFFETGAMLTPTKSQKGTNCGSGGLFQSYLTHS